jgi:hypothetical protein
VSPELGVFVPVYNGGDLLLETVASCVDAGLPEDRYRVLVLDNGSTDGAVDEVERRYGDRVEVIRNETNLGRIGNWNRCVETAEQRGFRFFSFLFVGDRWVSGENLAATLERMRHSTAAVALSAFEIRGRDNRLVRTARRFSLSARFVEVGGGEFLEAVIRTGVVPIAPLQADIFRVLPDGNLRFDPAAPGGTDIEATVDLLCRTGRGVLLSAAPFMAWRQHPGRFFMNHDLMAFAGEWTAQLRRLSIRTGKPVDWPLANALLVLNTALSAWMFVPLRRWPREGRGLLRQLRERGGGVSAAALLRYAAEQILFGRSILRFGEGGRAAGAGREARVL